MKSLVKGRLHGVKKKIEHCEPVVFIWLPTDSGQQPLFVLLFVMFPITVYFTLN